MNNVIEQETIEAFHEENTREIEMPDGSCWEVRMTPDLWTSHEFILAMEDVTEGELGVFALEEMELQGVTFDQAYRAVVAHLANRWE